MANRRRIAITDQYQLLSARECVITIDKAPSNRGSALLISDNDQDDSAAQKFSTKSVGTQVQNQKRDSVYAKSIGGGQGWEVIVSD